MCIKYQTLRYQCSVELFGGKVYRHLALGHRYEEKNSFSPTDLAIPILVVLQPSKKYTMPMKTYSLMGL